MTYLELLSTTEWKNKRYSIINRDKFKCQNCGNKKYLKNFKYGKIQSVRPCDSIGDFLNFDVFIKYIYKISFRESELAYKYGEVPSMQIHESTFTSYDYFPSENVASFKVIYEETPSRVIVHGVIESFYTSYRWIYARNLHVHHQYYQTGKNPWQYPSTALITLCWDCHEELHEHETVPWLKENGEPNGRLTNCSRCYGAGYIPRYSYHENGVCFECYGRRFKEFKQNPE